MTFDRKCLWCNKDIQTTHWNTRYCCLNHRNLYRNKYRQKAYGIKCSTRNPKVFISRLLLKRRYLKREIDLAYLLSIYERQVGKCALTGLEMTYIHGKGNVPTNISIDKIDPSKGYVKENIQLVCRAANMMKQAFSKDDLIYWCKLILKGANE